MAPNNPDERAGALRRAWTSSGVYGDMSAYMTCLDRAMDLKTGARVLEEQRLVTGPAEHERLRRASLAYATLSLSPANRRRVTRIADKIEFMLDDANGRRRTRISGLTDAAHAIQQAARKPGSWSGGTSGTVPNAYRYPAVTTAILAVRPPRSRTVYFNVGVSDAHGGSLGRTWPELSPWRGGRDRSLWEKLSGWVTQYSLDCVKIPVSLVPVVCDTLLRRYYGPPPIPHDADPGDWIGMWRTGETLRNPDESFRRLERAASTGDVNAQARHLVGLIRQGTVRADHIQSLASLGDPVAKLAVGKPESTEGLSRLVFTEEPLVRAWGPVWAVIAATSFLEVLDPELEEGGGGGISRLALSGQEWVGGRRRCNLREHSGPPIESCFWDGAAEWANGLGDVDSPSWVRYFGHAGTNYMLLVDSADSAVRGEPPRLYRSFGGARGAEDSFAYDFWPVYSHAANALSLKAPNTAYGFNFDHALRGRAIANLRPWIMAGSPDVWNMGGASLVLLQNPKDRPRKPIEVCCHMCHAYPGQRCRWAPGPEGFHCRRIQHAKNADRSCDCVNWPKGEQGHQ